MSDPLSKIGLGTWAFGGRAYGPLPDSQAKDIVRTAYQLGIRFFDTAHIYGAGRSEEILGEELGSNADAQFCTKIGYDTSSGKSVKRYDSSFLEASLALSLTRLHRDVIDLLLLHNPPTEVLEHQAVIDWLKRKVEQGVIRRWGVSVYDSIRDAEISLNAGAQAIEARYSLVRRDILDDVPKEKWKFQFIARNPLDGGLLTGKYSGSESFPSTDQRSALKPEFIQIYAKAASEFQNLISDGIALSLPELALRFSAFTEGVSIIIPGAKSVAQLESNVMAIRSGPLPVYALNRINQIRRKYMPLLFGTE